MLLNFTKMNGAGNDFIMIDNRQGQLGLSSNQVACLCDRHRGIGADGVIMLEAESEELPLKMRYYNADGHEAEMCGNGARCFTRYAADLLGQSSGKLVFQTQAGPIEGELLGEQVCLLMSVPHSIQLAHSLKVLDQEREVHSINTGVPHAVVFVQDASVAPVFEEGAALRQHQRFAPAGTNVNFVEVVEPNSLLLRTYERGVEDETLACGTGVVASAVIHHLLSGVASPIYVAVRGGETLQVDFTASKQQSLSVIEQVRLTGPADFVFQGTINL